MWAPPIPGFPLPPVSVQLNESFQLLRSEALVWNLVLVQGASCSALQGHVVERLNGALGQ